MAGQPGACPGAVGAGEGALEGTSGTWSGWLWVKCPVSRETGGQQADHPAPTPITSSLDSSPHDAQGPLLSLAPCHRPYRVCSLPAAAPGPRPCPARQLPPALTCTHRSQSLRGEGCRRLPGDPTAGWLGQLCFPGSVPNPHARTFQGAGGGRLRGFQRLPCKRLSPTPTRAGSKSERRGSTLQPSHLLKSQRPFACLILSHSPEPRQCHLLQEATLTSLSPGWPCFLVPQAKRSCSRSWTGPSLGQHAESAPQAGPGPARTLEAVTRLSPQLPVRMTARHGCQGWAGSARPERGGEAGPGSGLHAEYDRATRRDVVSVSPFGGSIVLSRRLTLTPVPAEAPG